MPRALADRFSSSTPHRSFSCRRCFVRTAVSISKILLKDGDGLIARARASLTSQFLNDPSATHLLFVDADIGFEPDQVLRLIECGAEMCAAVYPIKRIDWDEVKTTIETARPNPAAAGLKYVFGVEDTNAVIARSDFVRVRYAGTGFLMIRREALERMCTHYPSLQFKRDHSLDAAAASANRFAPQAQSHRSDGVLRRFIIAIRRYLERRRVFGAAFKPAD
jgi:hypothetical protein